MTASNLPHFPGARKPIQAPAFSASPPLSTRLLERIVAGLVSEPGPADERYFGTDLATLSSPALRRERARLHHAILLVERPGRWALERLRLIEGELEARRSLGPRRAATAVVR